MLETVREKTDEGFNSESNCQTAGTTLQISTVSNGVVPRLEYTDSS